MRYSLALSGRAGEVYGSNTPSSIARVAKVLSTPKTTSPSGLSLVRTSWLTSAPPSPGATIVTLMPVSSVNAASTSGLTLKESCVTSVIDDAAGPLVEAVLDSSEPSDSAVDELGVEDPPASEHEVMARAATTARAAAVRSVEGAPPVGGAAAVGGGAGHDVLPMVWEGPSHNPEVPDCEVLEAMRRREIPTSFAGANRSRFEGLRLPALSALTRGQRSPVVSFGSSVALPGTRTRRS